MFKSLLRTIPSLSGNVKINCYVENFEQDKTDKDKFYGFIKNADLSPLQNLLLNQRVKLSLLDGSWEYDISKYYHYYNNTFYNKNYSFNRSDYQILDLFANNQISSRNKDYEFGCKRVSYSQTGYQFNFFAPIWCDNFDSLPDYFRIIITFSNKMEKYINIPIKEYYNQNYLRNYLKRYLNKIDSNVIFGNQVNNQGTYYGIDVKNGGIVSIIDNIFSRIYNIQMTQNNFDNIICVGVVRNNLIIRQVLPLSFSFNIEDIMSNQEKYYFMNEDVKITGSYVKTNTPLKFYDFNINYYTYKFKYKIFNKKLKEFVNNTSSNICESSYPALEEKRYIGYKYSNKLTPTYNRWKLKCTSDKYPYITNINYAFNKKNTYIYGDYPIFLKYAKINNFDGSNFYIDYNDEEYINILNNNISTWFTLYNNIINMSNTSLLASWSDIIDNKTYYNGILYDFNNLYNDIDDKTLNFNKFGVFIEPELNVDNNSSKKIAKNILSHDSVEKKNNICINKTINISVKDDIEDENKINLPVPIYQLNNLNYNSCIDNDFIMYNGNEYDGYETYIEYADYLDNNRYYDYNEIYNYINKKDNIPNILRNKIIYGYYKLPLNYVENIYALDKENDKYTFIFSDFIAQNILTMYYSFNNSEKKRINDDSFFNYNFYDSNKNEEIAIYINKKFITIYDIYKAYSECYNDETIAIKEIKKLIEEFKHVKTYNYICSKKLKNFTIYNYFEDELYNSNSFLDRNKDNCIWISSYNLSNLIGFSKNELNNLISKQTFAKFLDIDNIKEYISCILNKDNNTNICDFIYLRQRVTLYDNNDIVYYDTFTKLSEIINYIDIYELLESLKYNSEKQCFTLYHQKTFKLGSHLNIIENNVNSNYIDVDLYFYDTFYVLNDKIYNYIQENNYQIYIYTLNNDVSKIYDNILYTYKSNANTVFYTWYELSINTNELYDIYSSSLKPLFYSTYTSNKDAYLLTEMFGNNKNKEINTIYVKQYNYNIFDDTKDEYIAYRYVYEIMQNLFIDLYIANNLGLIPECFNEKLTFDYIIDILLKPDEQNYQILYNKDLTNNELELLLDNYFNNEKKISDDEKSEKEDEITNCVKEILLTYPKTYKDANLRKRFFELNDNYLTDSSNNKLIYKSRKNIEVQFINDIDNNKIKNMFDSYKLNLYQYNNTNYLYYHIKIIYDNTSYSFNINDKNNILQHINTINNESIETYNIKNVNYNQFYKIYPYLKHNIFLTYYLTSKNIIKPYNYNINLYYYPVVIDNGSTNKSNLYSGIFYDEDENNKNVYDIYYNKSSKKTLNLNRYINDIEPLIEEINDNGLLNDIFELKYKTTLFTFGEKNIFKNTINIFRYDGIRVYDDVNNKDVYSKTNEIEYKHFNDNKLYNLEKEIIINFNETFTYEELLNLQNENIIIKHFGNYLNKSNFYVFDNNQILFLYNRYKLNILSNSVKLNKQKSEKLYTLAYKFTLY